MDIFAHNAMLLIIVDAETNDNTTAYYTTPRNQLHSSKQKIGDQNKRPGTSAQRYTTTTTVESSAKTILLHVVPVKILAMDGKSLTTYGLLDNGSRATVISADVAKQLQLRGRKETVYVSTLLERKEEELEVVKFVLQSATGDGEKITVEEGLISQKFNINESLPENIDKNEHPHLADIVIPIVDIPRVSVVIGKDVDEAHEVLEVRLPTQPTSKLQGQFGPLGWVITGTLSGDQGHRTELNVNFTDIENKNLREQIEKFWKIETYGTRNEVEELQPESLSREDVRAVEILDKTTRLTDDGHYETGLLWKRDDTNLPKQPRTGRETPDESKEKVQEGR
ncbi:hypothetical protein QZH41_003085 [Actinostola sp. cb2023]|nr:hypothetical protein QZH41_003085 [Actinostola sp. cb2023]